MHRQKQHLYSFHLGMYIDHFKRRAINLNVYEPVELLYIRYRILAFAVWTTTGEECCNPLKPFVLSS